MFLHRGRQTEKETVMKNPRARGGSTCAARMSTRGAFVGSGLALLKRFSNERRAMFCFGPVVNHHFIVLLWLWGACSGF